MTWKHRAVLICVGALIGLTAQLYLENSIVFEAGVRAQMMGAGYWGTHWARLLAIAPFLLPIFGVGALAGYLLVRFWARPGGSLQPETFELTLPALQLPQFSYSSNHSDFYRDESGHLHYRGDSHGR